MRVFLSSVGRRNYLVRWFRDGAAALGTTVEVWAGDGDPHAPGLVEADRGITLPPVASEGYLDHLVGTCVEGDVSLLLSLHDYDIARISGGALKRFADMDITAAVPPIGTLDVVADKLRTAEALDEASLRVPRTSLASSEVSAFAEADAVVKHRFGSASSGVFIVGSRYLESAITMSSISAPQANGMRPSIPDRSLVVIQERIEGEEFGLDVVCDFQGKVQGVLARKKLRMRAGETDRAITVDPSPFLELARRLAETLELKGNTDVDVIVTAEGDPYIIDINPRFGGGYPFVHLAGANVPACYLAWASGRDWDPAWLHYKYGVVSSKYEAIQCSGTKPT